MFNDGKVFGIGTELIPPDHVDHDRTREWDFDLKHIFILTSSGKPIFSKHGDEQQLSTTFGLIQAVVSIVENAGDSISCIIAGDRRIVYFLRSCLYFVSISSTEEPEAVLSAQLEFMHNQIIFVLTSQVHNVLNLNPSKDIRDLLGYDNMKQMHQSCCSDITPPYVAFNAVSGFVCAENLRHDITYALKNCIEVSGAVLGIILQRDRLLSYSTNSSVDLELSTLDVLLLANFVGKSNSLRSNDQNWIPICLPSFNPDAYLQAYVCNMHLNSASASKYIDISLVLISTSGDSAMFNTLHSGRQKLEQDLNTRDIPERLIIAYQSQEAYLSLYAVPISCINFLFIFRPAVLVPTKVTLKSYYTRSIEQKQLTSRAAVASPVQYHSFPLEGSVSDNSELDNILVEYQHLALHLRSGSSLPEHTLPISDSRHSSIKIESDDQKSSCNSNGADASSGSSSSSQRKNVMATAPLPLSANENSRILHSTLSSGLLVICVCINNSELYATFPISLSIQEAIADAKSLLSSLGRNACHLFHLTT